MVVKHGGIVFSASIPNANTETLLPIIKANVQPNSVVYTDAFKSYNALDVSRFHHHRINHSQLFCRSQRSYQRHRELSEPSKTTFAQLQRYQKEQLILGFLFV